MSIIIRPDISIIIPVYNAAKWLPRCLDSIRQQTFDNFEVMIVNDASSDNSLKIAMAYARRDNRLVIINKEKNGGTMSARESGYQKAQGKYITFSDADDYFPKNAFQILYDKITADHSDIVFGGYTIINNGQSERIRTRQIQINSSSEEIQTLFLKRKLPYTLWGNIYSVNLFRDYSPAAYPGMTNAEDRMLLVQLVSQAKRFSSVSSSCYNYCLNNESNSHPRISEHLLKNIMFSNDWCYQYLIKIGVYSGYVLSYHLYRIRYLLEIGYKFNDIQQFTLLDKKLYTFTSARNHVNLYFAIHYLLLQKSKLYANCYSGLRSIYHTLSEQI